MKNKKNVSPYSKTTKTTRFNMRQVFNTYCCGCGLCESAGYTKMTEDSKGFLFPCDLTPERESFCKSVCPASTCAIVNNTEHNIWGSYLAFFSGCSSNSSIRKNGSSGGVITAICCYLLEKGYVDAIIQTIASLDNPTSTCTVVSEDIASVKQACGSRYSKSSPLKDILTIIADGRRYAFVGKPCDVNALTNYIQLKPEVEERIPYRLSFFCAGTPSQIANNKLLERLNINVCDIQKLIYRGDGWPGRTKAIDLEGQEHSLDYQTAWMEILGRDIRLSCKFCFDSIGEHADISCGDYWYLNNDKKPDFSEHDGRNCIFAWSHRGKQLLEQMSKDGYLELNESDISDLRYAQPNHYNRRATLFTKMLIMKMFGKTIPYYKLSALKKYTKHVPMKSHLSTAIGTIRRIRKKSL